MGDYMEYGFENDFSGNYVVYSNGDIEENYEIKMLLNNKIKHVLETSVKRMDGGMKLYYGSKNMCSCEEYLKNNKDGYDHIKAFVGNINELCENLDEYLLSINHIILNENYIFINEESSYIEFLYNPFEEMDFVEGLKNLLSSILPAINHDDQATVLLAYGLMGALDDGGVTMLGLGEVVNNVEAELKAKGFYNRNYQESYIVDNYGQSQNNEGEQYKNTETMGMVKEEVGVVARKMNIKEVIAGKIEELVKKEKRAHGKKKYKERPVYQLEDKTSGK